MRLKIVIFYVLLATSWFVITTIPVLLSVLLPKVPRSILNTTQEAVVEPSVNFEFASARVQRYLLKPVIVVAGS